VVTTTADGRPTTSDRPREAIAYANEHPCRDTITFDASVFATPQIIT
jgi:hypothetical protein